VKLYDAARCPYCARVRMVLAHKGIEHETIEIDLGHRPAWLYELNASGKVPVLDDGFVLAESAVIMEYLEERYPEHRLLPDDPTERANVRLHVFRFDELLGDDYYAYRRGDANELARRLEELPLDGDLFGAIAFAPWVIRARDMLGVTLPARVEEWLDALAERPAFAQEIDVVRGLG
jgi:glutathione S-transferase